MSRVKRADFVNADVFLSRFSVEDRAAIEARAQVLIAEELTLRDLRKARDRTQKQVGAMLGIGQEHVSRLEQRTDLLLSTLTGYVEAMGGTLRLIAEFPDRAPVTIASLADVFETAPVKRASKRRRKVAAATA